ncbi:MAG: DNA translocase FtsK 4TM domain-containing protein [Acidaminococcaceae bacterium]
MDKQVKKSKKDESTKFEIIGVLLVAVSTFMFLALYGVSMGSLGNFTAKFLQYLLGKTAFVIPGYLLIAGFSCAGKHRGLELTKSFFASLLLVVCLIGITHYVLIPAGEELLPEQLPRGGGIVGGMVLLMLRRAAGSWGALIILGTGVICATILMGKISIKRSVVQAENGVKNAAESLDNMKQQLQEKRNFYDQEKFDNCSKKQKAEVIATPAILQELDPPKMVFTEPLFDIEEVAGLTNQLEGNSVVQENKIPAATKPESDSVSGDIASGSSESGYQYPPLSLLQPLATTSRVGLAEAVKEQSKILEQTLSDFNVKAAIVDITCGPSITRFELEPAPGVKVSKIQGLADDLALKLAVPGVRIEPIVGKAAIGVEVPNVKNEAVQFRSIVDCDEVKKAQGKLCVGLGKDISGKVVLVDLGKMPHLLVAGSTGSGKSVCINTIIASILFKATPDEVKLILVDPKVVELTNYNGIPHLLTPVVTNAKQAASALHWAVAEMERRYTLFAEAQVREVNRYNEDAEEKLPFIVIIIDELADLMMVAAVDVEDAILRLAQKARAAGIHLILATQRPSVDVIVIIKANIPSRIAFAVSSQTDSRTILDMGGAEKLLGKGDMLFYPIGANKPQRLQGAFVSDAELESIVEFIKSQAIPVEYSKEVTTQELGSDAKKTYNNDNEELYEDALFEDAVRLVMDTGQASSSMLQRKFRVGYTRAARLVDTMEELGIVGPAMGSKPRELIMSHADIEARFFTRN